MTPDNWRERYANLIVNRAAPVQHGTEVVISIDFEAQEFVPWLSDAAYRAGARFVHVDYMDYRVRRSRVKYAPDDFLDEEPLGYSDRSRQILLRDGSHFLVVGSDPAAFHGLDRERAARENAAFLKAQAPLRQLMVNPRVVRSILSYPSVKWATAVFPELPSEEALERLTDYLVSSCRLDRDDPVAAWDEIASNLQRRCSILTERRYDSLRYRGGDTHLELGLIDGHLWSNAATQERRNRAILYNLPTEEIFTTPHRNRAHGRAVATRDLYLMGQDFGRITLEWNNGVLVEAVSDRNQSLLDKALKLDENSSLPGEAALVPLSSPVAALDRPSKNLLFDENAGCHLAFGRGFSFSLVGGLEMSEEALLAAGVNTGIQHTDFIIGSEELQVFGVGSDGKEELIMDGGEFTGAFV